MKERALWLLIMMKKVVVTSKCSSFYTRYKKHSILKQSHTLCNIYIYICTCNAFRQLVVYNHASSHKNLVISCHKVQCSLCALMRSDVVLFVYMFHHHAILIDYMVCFHGY